MTGLRHRKKVDTRHRIIQAAAARFAAQGLDATTMEDVAAAADVSVGTVYNYFGTKNALLLAGLDEEASSMIERGTAVLTRPGANPCRAVQRLFSGYVDELGGWDRALLREVLAASFQRTGGRELTEELVHIDERLIQQLTDLLGGFEARGLLHPEFGAEEAAALLFSALVTQLFIYLSLEHLELEALQATVSRQVELAFAGLAAPVPGGRPHLPTTKDLKP